MTRVANVKSGGTIISSLDYSYDAVGNPTGLVEATGDRVTWRYEAQYQLTRERRSGTNAYDITYTYDAVGNRLTKLTGGVTTTYTYDAANQLTVENAGGTLTTYSYDANGNLATQNASGSVTTYTWDGENRMATATLPSGAEDSRRRREGLLPPVGEPSPTETRRCEGAGSGQANHVGLAAGTAAPRATGVAMMSRLRRHCQRAAALGC